MRNKMNAPDWDIQKSYDPLWLSVHAAQPDYLKEEGRLDFTMPTPENTTNSLRRYSVFYIVSVGISFMLAHVENLKKILISYSSIKKSLTLPSNLSEFI